MAGENKFGGATVHVCPPCSQSPWQSVTRCQGLWKIKTAQSANTVPKLGAWGKHRKREDGSSQALCLSFFFSGIHTTPRSSAPFSQGSHPTVGPCTASTSSFQPFPGSFTRLCLLQPCCLSVHSLQGLALVLVALTQHKDNKFYPDS